MIEKLKWLFFDAPTSITAAKEERKCDYCENTSYWTHYEKTGMTICHSCLKKIADNVLKGVK